MHEPAIELPRVLRGARLPFAQHVASVRLDVLLFSGATAIVAAARSRRLVRCARARNGPGRPPAARLGVARAARSWRPWSSPRLRAGARAAIAAVLGVLALEGAALAIADARAVGARGEDWTGFLLLPVGLVLLGLAAVLLWRSRKPGRFRCAPSRRDRARDARWRPTGSSLPVGDGDPRDAPPTRGRRARRPRTAVRAGHAADERRPRPRRLVRPLAATARP